MRRKRSIFFLITILFSIMLFLNLSASSNSTVYNNSESAFGALVESRRETTDTDRILQCLFISFIAGTIFILLKTPKKESTIITVNIKYLENSPLSIITKKDDLVDTQIEVNHVWDSVE